MYIPFLSIFYIISISSPAPCIILKLNSILSFIHFINITISSIIFIRFNRTFPLYAVNPIFGRTHRESTVFLPMRNEYKKKKKPKKKKYGKKTPKTQAYAFISAIKNRCSLRNENLIN